MKTTCELESGSFLGVALVVVFHEREREREREKSRGRACSFSCCIQKMNRERRIVTCSLSD
jgi:hypothetical protein